MNRHCYERETGWSAEQNERSKKQNLLSAEYVEEMTELGPSANADVGLPEPSSPSDDPQVTDLPLIFPRRSARLLRAKPWRTIEPLTDVDPEDVLTPIELDDTPSPAKSNADQPEASVDADVSEEHVQEPESCQPQELSLINKLLCFVNPFAKRPRRSA